MAKENAHVPAHLRRFVVHQDYARYNAMDQAVWRFVLLQTHARLLKTAHPTYREGLNATGISVDRIPRIAEMNDRLSRFGWGAVCVDGFLPPRAFQEFQAWGLLPIAGEIRTRQHLPYTPAPDIIHEAAGHAPILPDPVFAQYLRRIGRLGAEAFTAPEDDDVFQAVYALSQIKEDAGATPADIAAAEACLGAVAAAAPEASEAARLSRLYWWTAEYGLVGRPNDYKIYGAGLLSSLGESHSCHDPAVRKLPLDETCVDIWYDITRPQPQLFVASSFEALHDVLDRAERRVRGEDGDKRTRTAVAIGRAIRSREVASVALTGGAWVMGALSEVGPTVHAPGWLLFDGRAAFAWDDATSGGRPTAYPADAVVDEGGTPAWIVVGRLGDGRTLEGMTDAEIDGYRDVDSGDHRFAFASGAVVSGRLLRNVRADDTRLKFLDLSDATVALPGRAARAFDRYLLPAAGLVSGAQAGAVAPSFFGDTAFSTARVPHPRQLPARERRLLALYERAETAARGARRAQVAGAFAAVHAELRRDFPDEWLMRWNLLETLLRAPGNEPLKQLLRVELERLEVAFEHQQPIVSGLRYLAR